MIIKTFTAESATAALKKVREELGGEAIMLKTRELPGGDGKHIEVTACLERPSVAQASAALVARPAAKPSRVAVSPKPNAPAATSESRSREHVQDIEIVERLKRIEDRLEQMLSSGQYVTPPDRQPGPLGEVYRCLRQADVPADFVDSFVADLAAKNTQPADCSALARERLVLALSEIMLPELRFEPGDRVLVMGPAGSGKSSVMGKLAAHLVARERRKVRLVTLDDVKIAAFDEIASYAEILGTDISDFPSLADAKASDTDAITLIDTTALPGDADKFQALRSRIDQVRPTHRLAVYSALTRSDDMAEFAQWIEPLGPSHVVVTMLDLTSRHGSMLAAAHSSGLKIAFVTDAPGGVGYLKAPDPDLTARNLLMLEAKSAEV